MGKLVLTVFTVLLSARCAIAVLSKDMQPTAYAVTMTVTSTMTDAVAGEVEITLKCITATSKIELNWGSSLTAPVLGDITVTRVSAGATTTPTFTMAKTADVLTLTFTATAPATAFIADDVITVKIVNYKTTVNKEMKGLYYRQYYIDSNTKGSYIATYMKPAYAREVFPCMDDPAFYADIKLTLKYPSTLLVATSLPVFAAAATVSGVTTVTYKTDATTTPATTIPPYALSILLSDDMVLTQYTKPRSLTKINFLAPKGFSAGAVDNKNMEFLGDLFFNIEEVLQIPYCLAKDPATNGPYIVLLPDLDKPYSGFGMVFIRRDSYDNGYSSAQSEGRFKNTVCPAVEEILKQFTEFSSRPSSWGHSWLSSAISKFLEYVILTSMFPQLDFKTGLEVEARQLALEMDTETSKPLEDTITTDSTSLLETLIMDPKKGLKGAFLLSMLDMSFPAGTTFTAIKSFLNAKKNTFVTSSDFYTQIKTTLDASTVKLSTEAATAKTNLDFWFNTPGYPLLTTSVEKTGTSGSVKMALSPFCEYPPCTNTVPGYSVPATVGSKSDSRYYIVRQDIWVTSASPATPSLFLATGDWIVTNQPSQAYCRAQYSADNWKVIAETLTKGNNDIPGRTQLICDAFALSKYGALNYNTTMDIAVANMKETLYRNWFPLYAGLAQISMMLYGQPESSAYEAFIYPYLQNVNAVLKSGTMDSYEQARVKSLFHDQFCKYNIDTYRSNAISNASSLLNGELPTTIPSSIYDSVACCAGQFNSNLDPKTLWNNIIAANATYYQKRYNAIALGCFGNFTSVSALFTTMLSSSIELRPHIARTFMYLAYTNSVNLVGKIGSIATTLQTQIGVPAMVSVIDAMGKKLNADQASTLQSSVTGVDSTVKSTIDSTVTAVNKKASWISTNKAALAVALQSKKLSNVTDTTSDATTTTFVSLMLLFAPFVLVLVSV